MKVLSGLIINDIKIKSGLSFEMAKDYDTLANLILQRTGRSIGVNTLKRLMGRISDAREATLFVLNTIAIYLGADSWEAYNRGLDKESVIGFVDDSVIVRNLACGQTVMVRYLDREVVFEVVDASGVKALKVLSVQNGSLMEGDVAFVHKIAKGLPLEADMVIRGGDKWNYKTRADVAEVVVR